MGVGDRRSSDSSEELIILTPEDIKRLQNTGDPRAYVRYYGIAALISLIIGLTVGTVLYVAASLAAALIGGLLAGIIAMGTALAIERTRLLWIRMPRVAPTNVEVDSAVATEELPPIVIRLEDLLPAPGATPTPSPTPIRIDLAPTAEPKREEPPPVCPFCAEPLGGRPVHVCPHCRTPHHSECWQQNRGCTTLGCRGAPS